MAVQSLVLGLGLLFLCTFRNNTYYGGDLQLIVCTITHQDGRGRRCGPAPVCALYDKDQAACIIAFEAWARGHGLCDPLLPAEHRAWVVNEHAKCARKLIRSLKRIKAVAAPNANADSFRPKGRKGTESTATVPTLTEAETRLAERLTARFGADATLDDVRSDETALVGLMHIAG